MSLGLNLIDAKVSFDNSTILDHINLSIPTGEATAIIGPAASGKSVLFKYIPVSYTHLTLPTSDLV